MSKGSRKKHHAPKREFIPTFSDPSPEELEALEHDVDDEMYGADDAEYFRVSGYRHVGLK